MVVEDFEAAAEGGWVVESGRDGCGERPLPGAVPVPPRWLWRAAAMVESGSDVSLSFGALLLHLSRNNLARPVEVVDLTGGVIPTQGLEHITQGATHTVTTPVPSGGASAGDHTEVHLPVPVGPERRPWITGISEPSCNSALKGGLVNAPVI